MLFVSTLVSILLLLVSINAAEPSTSGYDNNTFPACLYPYYLIGDECLLVLNDVRGTWTQSRNMCLSLEGDLVSLSNANLLYDINNYIVANGMEGTSYWIGANDRDTEGIWEWSVNKSPVRMTSPIWGQMFGDQPNGGTDQNCGIISSLEYNYVHDEQCDSPMHGLICQAKQNRALESKETIPNIECPPEYDLIGSGCFKLYAEWEYTYEEAIDLCSGNNRHLAKLNDANIITDLHEYFIDIGTNEFPWIDGSDQDQENVWLHSDSSQVRRGTPFWVVYGDGQIQEPQLDATRNCLSMYYGYLYHLNDEPCTRKLGALCQYDT